MSMTRRNLLKSGAATLGAAASGLRFARPLTAGLALAGVGASARAADYTHATSGGEIAVHPVSHASFVLQTPGGVVYVDPVGGADAYADLPPAELILLTHEHGDHFDPETLVGLLGDDTSLVVNPAVMEKLGGALGERASAIGNGDATDALGMAIEAVPAYNLTEDRLKYHPPGRDNGYVMTIDGLRVYIAGDTEAIPEMRALKDIGVAFVPMNLPFTMDVEQAADGVLEFAPATVYPYHHKGSDIAAFAELVEQGNDDITVVQANWYG